MISPILVDELPQLAERQVLAESFFRECGLPGYFKFEAWLHNWTNILKGNAGVMWKFKSGETIVGLFGALLYPDINSGEAIATGAFWYVLPAYRRTIYSIKLLIGFEDWAQDMGAKQIHMAHQYRSAPTPPEDLASIYERRGYRPMEIVYVKHLSSSI